MQCLQGSLLHADQQPKILSEKLPNLFFKIWDRPHKLYMSQLTGVVWDAGNCLKYTFWHPKDVLRSGMAMFRGFILYY